MKCIWCRKESDDRAVEHIFPEALGCPEEFTLSGGLVCRRCNNGLAHLDQAVISDFDLPVFMANVPGKKGKLPAINTRGNIVASRRRCDPTIAINMEKFSVKTEDGTVIGAFGKSQRNVAASFTLDGSKAEIKFSTTIGQNPKFVRGIVKIGFSSLAYFLGPDAAYSVMFDPIRDFVLNGRGSRQILMLASKDPMFRNQAWPPYRSASGYFASVFRLFALEFCCDLSPDHSLAPILKQQASETMGSHGWSQLPPDKVIER